MNWKQWRRDRQYRLSRIMAQIGAATAIQFTKPGSDVVYYVHPSTYEGYIGQWQVSRVDQWGPSGHTNQATRELAIAAAIGAHPNPYWDEGDLNYRPTRTP